MQYTITDLEGDVMVVIPADRDGVSSKAAIAFLDSESGDEIVMLLDDRIARDLIVAINMALKESERIG